MPKDYADVYALLKQEMTNAVHGSAYNWVLPSLWNVFGAGVKGASLPPRKQTSGVSSISNAGGPSSPFADPAAAATDGIRTVGACTKRRCDGLMLVRSR